MPTDPQPFSGLQGACYGAFPSYSSSLWPYGSTRLRLFSGRSEDLKSLFDIVGGGDIRIQAVLVAFCFGGLLEALAGFGAPIAITATMILALGVKPSKAALAVLIANTAPVAYGAAGTPITTAGNMVCWRRCLCCPRIGAARCRLPLAARHRSSLSLFLCWLS